MPGIPLSTTLQTNRQSTLLDSTSVLEVGAGQFSPGLYLRSEDWGRPSAPGNFIVSNSVT
jgi:hypothetical protein